MPGGWMGNARIDWCISYTNLQKLLSSHFLNLDISIANEELTIRNTTHTNDLSLRDKKTQKSAKIKQCILK
jgi:hypothetical protein